MTTAEARELNERVAEKVLGWRRGRSERGEAPWILPDGVTAWTVRYFTTDAAADYEVLCHVRETWDGPARYAMMKRLTTMWLERCVEFERWLAYMPGDYSRAALAVMEGE